MAMNMAAINTTKNFLFLLVLVIFIAACGGSDSDSDEDRAAACTAYRVINGEECSNEDIPTVLLEISAKSGQGVCTGTLISNDDVLTAGHCLIGGPVNAVRVIHDRRAQDATAYAISRPYQQSGGKSNAVDLALVKVPGFATGAGVAPARIGGSTEVNRGDLLAFIGYGQDNDGNTGTSLPNSNPRAAFVKVEDVTNGIIFNTFEGTRSNPCFGDSGGAAIKDGKIVGIESGGTTQSCRTGDINLFAAISNRENLDFIREFVPSAMIE